MSILTPRDRRQAVDALLTQYCAYRAAITNEEKQKISNEMFFADPIVWLLYKYEAYQGTHHALTTWGDLVHHSLSHDGICGKRLQWVMGQLAQRGLSEIELVSGMLLRDVAASDGVVQLCGDERAMNEWFTYEYEKTGESVTKWQSFK